MLQLPSSERGAFVTAGPLYTVDGDEPTTCPVAKLAKQFSQLVGAYDAADTANDQIGRERAYNDQEQIIERASHFTPTSLEGAAFLVMLAHYCKDDLGSGATDEIKHRADVRLNRFFYRILEFVSSEEVLADIREFLMPSRFDPAFEKRPVISSVKATDVTAPR